MPRAILRLGLAFAALSLVMPARCEYLNRDTTDIPDIPENLREAIESKGSLTRYQAPVAPADWESAKPLVIQHWKEFLATAPGIDEQRRFAARHGLDIAFGSLRNKIGTFDRKTGRMVFDDSIFRSRWKDLQMHADAARQLAMESFPGFVHVIRDEMMNEDLAAHGFMYTGGWLEDEVIHNKEQAALIRYVEPFIDKDLAWGVFHETNQDILDAAAGGNAGLADYVRKVYRGIPALFYPRRDQTDYDPYKREIVATTDFEHHVLAHREELDGLEDKMKQCAAKGFYVTMRKISYDQLFRPVAQCGLDEETGAVIAGSQECRRRCNSVEQAGWAAEAAVDRKRLAFFADSAALDRLRVYYRAELARFGIRPEELK